MKKTLSTMAAAAVLMASTALAPAMAQTTDPASPASPAAPADPAMKPMTGSDAAPVGSPDSAAAPTADTSGDVAAAPGAYLTEQSETQISANDYIGKPVYNSADESVGDINDLILEKDGGIVAAVIGVGGFLGIGEKDVAVPMENITMTTDVENNNEVRLTTTETAESLGAAPEFQTLDDQQAAADSAVTDTTTTSSTGEPKPLPGDATNPPTAEDNN